MKRFMEADGREPFGPPVPVAGYGVGENPFEHFRQIVEVKRSGPAGEGAEPLSCEPRPPEAAVVGLIDGRPHLWLCRNVAATRKFMLEAAVLLLGNGTVPEGVDECSRLLPVLLANAGFRVVSLPRTALSCRLRFGRPNSFRPKDADPPRVRAGAAGPDDASPWKGRTGTPFAERLQG